MAEEHETFDEFDESASLTYPTDAASVRKGGYVVINGRPCKVLAVNNSKTGKHGHAKVEIVGIDIFTGKKYEDILPSSHNVDVPKVSSKEYTAISIDDEGLVTIVQEEDGITRTIALPNGGTAAEEVARQLKGLLEQGDEVAVYVIKAMNEEMISSIKTS